MEDLPADLKAFLLSHPFFQLSDNKIKCTLNGHEFPCNLAELQSFIKGKKYQKLSAVAEFGYSSHQHIVPSGKQPNQLFCKLTLTHLNRQPQHVLKHVSGKRYKKALEKYKQCLQQGIEYIPAKLSRKRREEDGGGEVKKGSNSGRNALWETNSSEEDHSDSEDSMSDLYPSSMFPKNEEVEVVVEKKKDEDDFQTDDDDDEEMVVENQAPQKRKKFQGDGGLQKKFKNNKFKRRGVKSTKVKNGE